MPTTLAAATPTWSGVERTLGPEEIQRRIRAATWAILTVLDGSKPYAVPMAYGFDGRRFFVATCPGRKRRALDAKSLVSLTIVDPPEDGVSGGGYVLVLGRATPVPSLLGRLRAGILILRRFSGGRFPSWTDLRRMIAGRAYRIEPHEVAGRELPI